MTEEEIINKEDYPSYMTVCNPCKKADCKGCKTKYKDENTIRRKFTSTFKDKGSIKKIRKLLLAYLDSLNDLTEVNIQIESEEWISYAKEISYYNGETLVFIDYEPLT